MAKVKEAKAAVSVSNKALYSRVSYLFQAATYLATRELQISETAGHKATESGLQRLSIVQSAAPAVAQEDPIPSSQPLARQLLSDLRSVSLKTQIRLSPAMKHSICKRCNARLIDGSTCTNEVENKSKGGKKPWADVLVRTCKSCGCERRFPVAAIRQTRRQHRLPKALDDYCSQLLGKRAAEIWPKEFIWTDIFSMQFQVPDL